MIDILNISSNRDISVNDSLDNCWPDPECIGVIRNNRGENYLVRLHTNDDLTPYIRQEDGYDLYTKSSTDVFTRV